MSRGSPSSVAEKSRGPASWPHWPEAPHPAPEGDSSPSSKTLDCSPESPIPQSAAGSSCESAASAAPPQAIFADEKLKASSCAFVPMVPAAAMWFESVPPITEKPWPSGAWVPRTAGIAWAAGPSMSSSASMAGGKLGLPCTRRLPRPERLRASEKMPRPPRPCGAPSSGASAASADVPVGSAGMRIVASAVSEPISAPLAGMRIVGSSGTLPTCAPAPKRSVCSGARTVMRPCSMLSSTIAEAGSGGNCGPRGRIEGATPAPSAFAAPPSAPPAISAPKPS